MRAIRKRLLAIGAAVLVTGALALSHTNVADAQAKPGAKPPAAKTVSKADKAKAKKIYGEAQNKLKAGDFAGALPLFQEAESLYPGAAPKHNIAVCLDKLGRTEEAVAAYRTFIDSKPDPEKYGERVTSSRQRVAELEATMLATITLEIRSIRNQPRPLPFLLGEQRDNAPVAPGFVRPRSGCGSRRTSRLCDRRNVHVHFLYLDRHGFSPSFVKMQGLR